MKLIGIAKHAGTFFDFWTVLEFAAQDTETAQGSAVPIPHALGLATAPIIEHAKAEWDEATDAAIQKDLEEVYKPKGLAGIQEFVNKFGEFQKYELKQISKQAANKMILGEFETMDNLDTFDQDYNPSIYILFRNTRNNEKQIIETIIYDE